MTLTGIVSDIFEIEFINDRFHKRVLWLQEVGTKYPNCWQIEFWNDDCKELSKFQTGQMVNVNISVIGRKSLVRGQEKVFTTLRGLKIEKVK